MDSVGTPPMGSPITMHDTTPAIGLPVKRNIRRWFVLPLVLLTLLLAEGFAKEGSKGTGSIVPLLQQHCTYCHGEGGYSEADLDLTGVTAESLEQDAELVRKLIHALDTRAMPPEDSSDLSPELREEVLIELQPILHKAAENAHSYRRAPIRRMNRFQYNNAVVDLFGLNCIVFTLPERAMRVHGDYFDPSQGKVPNEVTVGNRPLGKSQMIEPRLAGVAAFPQDLRAEHGYDNQGDHLSLSPLLMDEFLKLGQSITQSPDFGPRRVGIWQKFFAPPKSHENESQAVRERLRLFLTKAFRTPATESLIDRYARYVESKLAEGENFTEVMKSVAAAAIASPRFLYLYDKSVPETEETFLQAIDDFELASRMSFFLWGSLPDMKLLTAAEWGELRDPAVLEQQIDRMLQDKKLKRFCDSFPSQWLQLDRIVSSVPNPEKYPDFYFAKYRMSMHMMLEPLLLFETVLIEDLPITQLIDSDFTYRSFKLNQSYGDLSERIGKRKGGDVTVLTFRRVPVTDRRNGGVITNAAVMTMTSGPDRTQPITRGAWVAGVIFNDPPEPPPADVPPLPEESHVGEENLPIRERLAAHRQRADCRGCHEQIDPLGFALENYNLIGKWREQYENGTAIDASGQLFRQHDFTNAVEFKEAILADPNRFCRALAGHLLSFALARELGPADQIALDKITQAVANDGYKMQTLMKEIILSKPFRTKS
ncbi:Cytochrome c [Planctomycetales bacterium 10988]|nr:Cytochrome c [Planctomycetales bacterium 10988]